LQNQNFPKNQEVVGSFPTVGARKYIFVNGLDRWRLFHSVTPKVIEFYNTKEADRPFLAAFIISDRDQYSFENLPDLE
jgi:hypothetical protein